MLALRLALLLLPAAAAAAAFAPAALAFGLACLSLIPLARELGDATEDLAGRFGPTAGALLNATCGNAAELILGFAALRHGNAALVRSTLTGSVIGNLLLVAGAAVLAGGLRRSRLQFDRVAAGAGVSTLFLGAVAFTAPAALGLSKRARPGSMQHASIGIAAILMVMYGLSLVFALRTQERVSRERGSYTPRPELAKTPEHRRPLAWPLLQLALAAVGTAWASELVVDHLEAALPALGLGQTFVGVVVLAVAGNAAEHAAAIRFGLRGDLDLALGIAWESSKQIALFVGPLLVLAGAAMGTPLPLAFTAFELAAIGSAVLATAIFALDGETHWLEGAFLLAVYGVLALVFFYLP